MNGLKKRNKLLPAGKMKFTMFIIGACKMYIKAESSRPNLVIIEVEEGCQYSLARKNKASEITMVLNCRSIYCRHIINSNI